MATVGRSELHAPKTWGPKTKKKEKNFLMGGAPLLVTKIPHLAKPASSYL
jgi:hypothetical protein